MDGIEKCCKKYFDNYSKNYRKAWLLLRKKRYQEIVDNGSYLGTDAEIFKNEVMKFWAGKDGVKGWSDRNSWIKKKNSDEWILFHDKQADIPNYEKIIENLNNGSLDLCGNYSWSKLSMGVRYGAITDDMQKLKETLYYLFDENIDIADRFNKAMEIAGMGHGKVSMFLHIKYPNKYGVWNSCTDATFKILSEFDDSRFNIGGSDNGEKYKKINEQLRWLLKNHKQEDENSSYGFKNLSDVDIFVWYVANQPKNKK